MGSKTTDQAAVQITRDGYSWAPELGQEVTVSYGFRSSTSYLADAPNFTKFNAAQIQEAELALGLWSDVANIHFVRAEPSSTYTNNATILFSNYNDADERSDAFMAQMPTPTMFPNADTTPLSDAGDVYIDWGAIANHSTSPGTSGFETMMHEIGHAIGLEHPGDYDANDKIAPTYGISNVYAEDTDQYSIMSYFGGGYTGADWLDGDDPGSFGVSLPEYWQSPATPMLHDIAAAQRLYGANYNTRNTDTTYGFHSNADRDLFHLDSPTEDRVFAVWDGGGIDTFDFSGYSDNQLIDLHAESFSNTGGLVKNVAIAKGVLIENAIGGLGDDTINGNYADNVINGGPGVDTMSGFGGDDKYYVSNTSDKVIEGLGCGYDRVVASADYTLPYNVERLDLIGFALKATGNSLANVIYGNTFNNTIDGKGDADLMLGGDGNDTYYVENPRDTVIELPGEGAHDKVIASIDKYTLPNNVEDLQLGSNVIFGYGNSLANIIEGNDIANIIDGNGGADTMRGFYGDDIYYVDNPNDVVEDVEGPNNDVVNANIDFYQMPKYVETLYLTYAGGSSGVGNELANKIYGNEYVNVIDGGKGADTMNGGGGDDYYIVDDLGDKIVESEGGGNDTVVSSVTYTLSSNVDNLFLSGASALNAYGNASNNALHGNEFKNTLDGGMGADVLEGGGDNDTFVFHRGEANRDHVVDFNGNGAFAGDQLKFVGYGAGATFTKVDSTHWQINDGALHETITFDNAASIHATDYWFV